LILCGGELANGGFEDASVEIDVGICGGGRHQRHVVERGEQNAAIERIEMHVALKIEIGCGSGFSSIARRVGTEKIFGAAAQTRYVPRKVYRLDRVGYTLCKSLRERNHMSECLGRKNVFECGADRG